MTRRLSIFGGIEAIRSVPKYQTRYPALLPDKWSSVMEKAQFTWCLDLTPTLPYGRERHLDVEPPSALIELESTNRQYSIQMPWSRSGVKEASTHFVKVRGESARSIGRSRYW